MMLASKLKVVNDEVSATFEREGPLCIEDFQKIANYYKLPEPTFSDADVQFRCIDSSQAKFAFIG